MWKGLTLREKAPFYHACLIGELFPRLRATLGDKGYRGYNVLMRELADGKPHALTEFVTLVWFDSLEPVKSFASALYEKAVISEQAASLLVEHWPRAEHYDLRGASDAVCGQLHHEARVGVADEIHLRQHRPGDLGWIVHRHGALYAREYWMG